MRLVIARGIRVSVRRGLDTADEARANRICCQADDKTRRNAGFAGDRAGNTDSNNDRQQSQGFCAQRCQNLP